MKKYYFVIAIILAILAAGMCVVIVKHEDKPIETNNDKPISDIQVGSNYDFDYDIIKKANESYKNNNYMISPLSIGYALTILDLGASDNTKKEIDGVLKEYKLPPIIKAGSNISIANALFIKNDFKNAINSNYVSKIKNDFDADTIYDEFKSPDILNNWVNEKTYKMIPKIVENMNPNFVLGIVNAIAIDVEWATKFECSSTTKQDFTKLDGTKMQTAMMRETDNVEYFETNNSKGIIKQYKTYGDTTLEYIAILPNDINSYINNFNNNELKNIYKGIKNEENTKVRLSLPKYTYDFSYDTFKKDLISLGIKDAFNDHDASFKNITSNNDIYVYEAIHKSHIELSENGTKAAAVTAFMMNYKSAIDQSKYIDISFDKPFIYIIKDKNTDNIWFFGTVYEPMKYEDHKCETKMERE